MERKMIIPDGITGKELFTFLKDNSADIIRQKKSIIKFTEPIFYKPEFIKVDKSVKVIINDLPPDATMCPVKAVGNACNWCDSQMDVLLDNSSKRTIKARQGMIPHLPDHTQKLEAQIGDMQDVYLDNISLKDLGLSMSGSTQCIVFDSNVQKSYNEKVFNLYKNGKVTQHSIGLNYKELYLAINEPDDEYFMSEYGIWEKYYDSIINKDAIDEAGFFWAVKEIMLLEISGVLFGSNELTPTLEVGGKSILPKLAKNAPEGSTTDTEDFDVNLEILTTKFF